MTEQLLTRIPEGKDSKRQIPWSEPEQLFGHSFAIAKVTDSIGGDDDDEVDDDDDNDSSSAKLLQGLLASPEPELLAPI